MDIEEGQLFCSRYKLIAEKGRGAFGEVWLAHDEQIDLDVAVKIYIALDQKGIEDFKSEYKNSYFLNHPNLLHAYHFDVLDKRPFLVMPYCPRSAETLVGTTDEKEIWRFIRDVSSGLSYLHSKNILHRDIKPDNILVDKEGSYLITDFGVSTKMKSTLRRNSTRALSDDDISGTIGYMAPELFSKFPESVKASDIWALGATIFEIVNQEIPFYGQGGIMQERGAAIPELKGAWSEDLRLTVEACLAKETWNRPTAAQLAEYASDCANGNYHKAPWKIAKPDEEGSNVASGFDSSTVVRRHNRQPSPDHTSDKERIEICKTCKNRGFDYHAGIVCGLSGKKPDFHSSCSNMSFDQEEANRIEEKKAANEESDDIHGWMAFFLWVGIGGGLLVSTIRTFVAVFARGTDCFTRWYSLIYLAFFLFIGIKAIIAFYRRKDNAVALATTYCIMIALDAILYFLGTADSAWMVLRHVLWACIWLTFLYCSEDVKEICLKETRKWHATEIATLSIYSAATILMIIILIGVNSQPSVPAGPPARTEQKDISTSASKTQSPSRASSSPTKQEAMKESQPDANAAKLQNALRKGDYAAVRQFADAGYSAAYIPLAKYYLKTPSTHALADIYAKKAKRLGLSGAQEVLDDLAAFGFYD